MFVSVLGSWSLPPSPRAYGSLVCLQRQVAHASSYRYFPNLPVQPFRCPKSRSILSERASSPLLCPPSGPTDHRSCSPVSITPCYYLAEVRNPYAFIDFIAIVCIVVFALKRRTNDGQSRMTLLMRTILQDSVLYFLIVASFHIAMVFFTYFARVTVLLPLTKRYILIPRYSSLPSRVSHRSRSSRTCLPIPIQFVS